MTNSELYPGLLTVIVILENSTVLLYEFLYKIKNFIVNYLFSVHKNLLNYLIMTSVVTIELTAYFGCKNLALTSINELILLLSIVKTIGSDLLSSITHFSIAGHFTSSGKSGSGVGDFFCNFMN